MFPKSTIKDLDLQDKIVLLRTDYNVPLKDGNIANDLRIRASLPTLDYLLSHGVKKLIIISHLGRPKGPDASLSLQPIAERLAKLLPDHPVHFVHNVSGPEVENAVNDAAPSSIILLENLRFYDGEKGNSLDFAQSIVNSTRADLFVQDGFAVMHRAHASTSAITNLLPSVAGLLVEKEVTTLSSLLQSPKSPFLVIIGGAKVADKAPLIEHFEKIADHIFVGGKIAADGYASDSSKIIIASDFAKNDANACLDIGPKSIKAALNLISQAKTILWNGTLGMVEVPPYDNATRAIAQAIGHKTDITSVLGGGDITAFVENLATSDPTLNYTLISTGGGATLEFLLNGTLPGLDALAKIA